MTVIGAEPVEGVLPSSAWTLGWLCLLSELLGVLARPGGGRDATSTLLSVALSAALVAWVSAGVLRARMVRLVFAWIVFGFQLLALVVGAGATLVVWHGVVGVWGLMLILAVAEVATLARFCRTDYFRHRRLLPAGAPGPSIVSLVAMAAVVGAIGGFAGSALTVGQGWQLHIGL